MQPRDNIWTTNFQNNTCMFYHQARVLHQSKNTYLIRQGRTEPNLTGPDRTGMKPRFDPDVNYFCQNLSWPDIVYHVTLTVFHSMHGHVTSKLISFSLHDRCWHANMQLRSHINKQVFKSRWCYSKSAYHPPLFLISFLSFFFVFVHNVAIVCLYITMHYDHVLCTRLEIKCCFCSVLYLIIIDVSLSSSSQYFNRYHHSYHIYPYRKY